MGSILSVDLRLFSSAHLQSQLVPHHLPSVILYFDYLPPDPVSGLLVHPLGFEDRQGICTARLSPYALFQVVGPAVLSIHVCLVAGLIGKVRGTEINNSPILLVFQLVFCVASKDTYFNMLPLMRLEYELKSCAIFVELFSSVPLTASPTSKVFTPRIKYGNLSTKNHPAHLI